MESQIWTSEVKHRIHPAMGIEFLQMDLSPPSTSNIKWFVKESHILQQNFKSWRLFHRNIDQHYVIELLFEDHSFSLKPRRSMTQISQQIQSKLGPAIKVKKIVVSAI